MNSVHRLQSIVAVQYMDGLRVSNTKYADPRSVTLSTGQVYSQNNEDGVIAEIFRRIGTESKTFVEVAAGDGIENTTRLLLDLGWSGIWVEGDAAAAACAREVAKQPLEHGQLVLVDQHISLGNIEGVLLSRISFQPDYISVDIDYNTSHIWRKLLPLQPRVFCVEYNAHYPPSVEFELPYSDDRSWQGTTRFGASLKALERIGANAGYCLVGCDAFGVNAFFVREDLCSEDTFLSPFTAETHYEPPRFNAVQMRGHPRQAKFDL